MVTTWPERLAIPLNAKTMGTGVSSSSLSSCIEKAEIISVEFMYMLTRLLSSISSMGQRKTLGVPRFELLGELGGDIMLEQNDPSGILTSCATLVLDKT